MSAVLEPNDIRLIRGILKGQKVVFAFLLYLMLTFAVCFLACLYGAATDSLSLVLMFLGAGSGVLTYFLARAAYKSWKQVIYPLQSTLRSGKKKTVVSGQLGSVALSGKGEVTYEIDGNLIPTYPVLLHHGLALLPDSLYAVDALLHREISLHLFVMPDGRHILLDTRYPAHALAENTLTHRITSQNQMRLPGALRYFFYTVAYLFLLFIVFFVVPIGVIFGLLPLTIGYVIVLWNEKKRQRNIKKLYVTEVINGSITEVIKTRARIQVMGVPTSNNYDIWFRIDGKPYLIRSDEPLPRVSIGDGVELTLN